MTLLIVDDEIYAVQAILDRVDWDMLSYEHILTANSYSQAINILLLHQVNVLLSDIEMPNGSGVNLVAWVKENSPDTECIFVTCHEEFGLVREAVRLQCLDYLLKPATKDALEVVLAKAALVIQNKQQESSYRNYGKLFVDNVKERFEKSDGIVETVEDYVREHISEQITVEELAKLAFISTKHLTRLFKKQYGVTMNEYITQKRMNLAKELIKQGDMSLSAISLAVGYLDYSYFIRVFKKTYGQLPKECLSK